ncbi:beta-fructofuranosidase, cell wall isozyme-like isoform X2 [Tasmannia lanceolata]|uniref:beta-fructofuranosidase, cell wall isozyme-like isoform X2 n=1 Tax=Tasmannia lanceolata TaxID=3420 RepID=UPI004062B4E3
MMAMSKLVFPVIWVLFLCYWFSLLGCENGVEASHVLYPHLKSVEASIVDKRYRTGYHFQPPKNWINGPMYYNGVYHLFYQYNPKGARWGNIVWAHSVSMDMINWMPLKPAIYPSKLFDIKGCWSGSATILPGNLPAILYTGIDPEDRQVQNIAFPKNLSDPYLIEWDKPDYNPIIEPIDGINSSSFRDPTTAWRGSDGWWRVLVGSKTRKRGEAILYRSRDFKNWVKAPHPLHSSQGTGMWECPDFYPVSTKGEHGLNTTYNGDDVKHVLKVSLDDKKFEYYTIGQYMHEMDLYVPDRTLADNSSGLRYDYGKYYASKTFFDDGKNRRILWGWVNESDSVTDSETKGWAGVQTIPRVVRLDKNGKQLVQWPIAEVKTLRRKPVHLHHKKLMKGELFHVKGIIAPQADVEVEFRLPSFDKAEIFDPSWVDPQILCSQKGVQVEGSIGPFGLFVLASESLDEYTAVFFRIFKAKDKHVVLMCSDQSRSTLRTEVDKTTYGAFVDVDLKHGKLSLRSLIDRSIVESFGGEGRACITARVYPTKAVGSQARLYAFNYGSEPVRILKLKAWTMLYARTLNDLRSTHTEIQLEQGE